MKPWRWKKGGRMLGFQEEHVKVWIWLVRWDEKRPDDFFSGCTISVIYRERRGKVQKGNRLSYCDQNTSILTITQPTHYGDQYGTYLQQHIKAVCHKHMDLLNLEHQMWTPYWKDQPPCFLAAKLVKLDNLSIACPTQVTSAGCVYGLQNLSTFKPFETSSQT